MTLESGSLYGHSGLSLPQETKTYETAYADDDKRVIQLGKIFGKMLRIANGPNGLPRVNANMDEFDLDHKSTHVGRHLPGLARTALFKDGLWVRVTTSDDEDLIQAQHTLHIVNHEVDMEKLDTYQITVLNRGADPVDRYMEGLSQIAAGVGDMYEFGKIVQTYETEALKNRWQNSLSANTIAYARLPRSN